jgi:GntR family transcriptional regulator
MSGDPAGVALSRLVRLLEAESRSNEPKHRQLLQAIERSLGDGVWQPGDRFPTEAELQRALPFSLGTIQRAIQTLKGQGRLLRGRRRGTVVADSAPVLPDPLHLRFMGEDGQVLAVSTRTLTRRSIVSRAHWARGLARPGQQLLRIDRLFSVDGRWPVGSRFYANPARFPALATRPARDLAGENFKLLLGREFGHPIASIVQTVQALRLPLSMALVLGAVEGLRVDVLARGADGTALYYQEIFVPGGAPPLAVAASFSPAGGQRG